MATIKVIRDIDGFKSLKDKWNQLTLGNSTVYAFQTFDWNYAVWEKWHLKKREQRLFIIYVTRDGHPEEAVIFPFFIDGGKCLKFISSTLSDVLDAVYADHPGEWHVLYSDVAKFISSSSEISEVELSKIPEHSEIGKYFPVYMPNVRMTRMDAHSGMQWHKAEKATDSMTNLNSKERSYVRSLLLREGANIELCSISRNRIFPREEILSLRSWMISKRWRAKASLPLEYFDCMELLYQKGMCEISIGRHNDDVVLIAFRLPYKDRIVFWLVMYKEAKYVSVADAHYIGEKLREGDAYFDWGTGAYSYKLGTFRPNVYNLFKLETRSATLQNFIKDMLNLCRFYLRSWLIAVGVKRDRFHPASLKAAK